MDKTFGTKLENVSYYDREGAYIIAVKNNFLATVRTPLGYFLIGGGIENGESHIDCIKRECLEEIGCKIEIGDYICCADSYCMHYKLGHFHPVQHYYSAQIGEKISEPAETDHEFVWLPIEDTDKLFVEQQIWAVKKYIKSLKN